MAATNRTDTREGARVEAGARALLDRSRPLLLRVIQNSARLADPPADSWLGRVDARTAPFEASQSARLSALVAADNLRQVERTLRSELPPFALYSMIRSAVEAASLGLWVLDAKDEQVAASRTLRIRRQNIASDRTMWKMFMAREGESHQLLHDEAERLHGALRGVSQSHFEEAVRSTDVVAAVDRLRADDGDPVYRAITGLEVWRATSSIAHGNPVSMMHLLERHPDGALGEPATRTSRLSYVASFYVAACVRTESLITAFRARSRPRRSGR